MADIFMAVVHFPALDRNGRIVATSINSMEIHDLSRICMTYDVKLCYIVTPLERQIDMLKAIKRYWLEGPGLTYNRERAETLKRLKEVESVEEVLREIQEEGTPFILGTSATHRGKGKVSEADVRRIQKDRPVLILLGTGYGLADETLSLCDAMLPPIRGRTGFNHLPMRVAAGILIDRILGRGGVHE